jgi:hypothetical protein
VRIHNMAELKVLHLAAGKMRKMGTALGLRN